MRAEVLSLKDVLEFVGCLLSSVWAFEEVDLDIVVVGSQGCIIYSADPRAEPGNAPLEVCDSACHQNT
jgi:hypothetical protein